MFKFLVILPIMLSTISFSSSNVHSLLSEIETKLSNILEAKEKDETLKLNDYEIAKLGLLEINSCSSKTIYSIKSYNTIKVFWK